MRTDDHDCIDSNNDQQTIGSQLAEHRATTSSSLLPRSGNVTLLKITPTKV